VVARNSGCRVEDVMRGILSKSTSFDRDHDTAPGIIFLVAK